MTPAPPPEPARRSARADGVVLALAAIAFAAGVVRWWGYLVDDAFISFRYARNLVEGHGLVFNPGERVEGYTNFLFVCLAAGALAVGADPVAATRALGVAAAAWAVGATARLAAETAPSAGAARGAARAAAALLLGLPAFAYWAVVPFETVFFTAFLAGGLAALFRETRTGRGRGAAVAFALLALTRPEGIALFALATAAVAATAAARGAAALRPHVRRVAVVGAVWGTYFALRWAYYGAVLPNTFAAKVTGGEGQWLTGLRYPGGFAVAVPAFGLALAAPVLVRRQGGRAGPSAALAAVVAALGLYVVAVGGDSMPFFRFFVPAAPLVAVLAAHAIAAAGGGARAVAALVVATVVLAESGAEPVRAFVAHRTTEVGARVGAWFASRLGPDDRLAVNTAGSLPYHARLPTIDMLGLADPAIARRPVWIASPGWAGHRRGWGAYVRNRRPAAVLWYNSAGAAEPFYLGDRELADDPYFRFFWSRRRTELPGPTPGRVLVRLVGDPFEIGARPDAVDPSLGIRASRHPWLPLTVVREAPVTVEWFERDRRDDGLWDLVPADGGNPDAFVDAVAARWRAAPPDAGPPPEPAAVDAVLADVERRVAADDLGGARTALAAALVAPATARAPRVWQYVANVGVLSGDLPAAVAGAKEALRLRPASVLYRTNLEGLLRAPWGAALSATARRAAAPPATPPPPPPDRPSR